MRVDSLKVIPIICSVFAFAFYLLTLAPTFGWGDSADLAMRMVFQGDTTFVNGSRNYTLYLWVGSVFQALPFADAGFKANIMAAFFGGVSVGIVSFISLYITRNIYAAFATAIALTVAHSFWLLSVTAEVYTFNAALAFGYYAFMVVWWRTEKIAFLFAASVFAGLALSHHATGLVLTITLAPLILWRWRTFSILTILSTAAIFFAVSFFYWEQAYIRLLANAPLLSALSLQAPSNNFFDTSPLRELLKFFAYAGYNFFGIGIVLAGWGILIAWRKKLWELLPAFFWLCLIVFAGVTSSIPDKFNIYVLAYPVLAIAIGLAVAEIKNRQAIIMILMTLAALPPLGYVATIYTTKYLGVDLVHARQVPYRDNTWYFLWPSKRGDFTPRRYATEALTAVDANSVLIADYSLWRPLYFMQAIEKMRPDVELEWVERLFWKGSVVDYIDSLPCTKNVFLASNNPPKYYQLDNVLQHYNITQMGVVFRVERRCKN